MKIVSSLKNFYQAAKKAVGKTVVGDDFSRADGTVDGIVLGTAAGAAVGGTIGAAKGFYAQSRDQVTRTENIKTINDPQLNGHRYFVSSDWDRRCFGSGEFRRCERELSGWRHSYSPNITNRVVGTYEEPGLEHSHHGTAIGTAVAGVAIGAGLGAALGLATGVVGKAIGAHPLQRKPLPPEMREQLIDDAGETILTYTAFGAATGAAFGLGAGLIESSSSLKLQETWQRPLLTNRNLGEIPRGHYEWNGGGWRWGRPSDYSDFSPSGTRSVIREAPVLDSGGTPQLETVTTDLDSQRFGVVSGVIGGAMVGAGVGFATGVTSSVINRVLIQPPQG